MKKYHQQLGKIVDKLHKLLANLEKEALKVHSISCRLYEDYSDAQKNKPKKKLTKKVNKKK